MLGLKLNHVSKRGHWIASDTTGTGQNKHVPAISQGVWKYKLGKTAWAFIDNYQHAGLWSETLGHWSDMIINKTNSNYK